MTDSLTETGYVQTKQKLANMEARLAALQARTDLGPIHKREAETSCIDMIRQYKRNIKLYELRHPQANASQPAGTDGASSDAGRKAAS
jgi:hypothetical protein